MERVEHRVFEYGLSWLVDRQIRWPHRVLVSIHMA